MESNEELNHDGIRPDAALETFDTVALQKKRARRVSFAELTSVHFFDRDEEFNEAPSLETEDSARTSASELSFDGNSDRLKVLGGDDDCDDDNDNDDDEEMEVPRSFLRPAGSPSPGGSTFGSASSNDDENFFGPVSAKFIRRGQLSDSAASDDDRDMTMDSTAFSMHYRSIARSDSGADSKIQATGQFSYQEETPINENPRSSMVYTLDKMTVPESVITTNELSGKSSFSDMSLIGENPSGYEYERLSPESNALLVEMRNKLQRNRISNNIATSGSHDMKEVDAQKKVDHVSVSTGLRNVVKEPGTISSGIKLHASEFVAHSGTNARHGPSPSGHSGKILPPSRLSAEAGETESQIMWHRLITRESETTFLKSTSPVKPGQVLFSAASPGMHLHVNSPLLRVEHDESEKSLQKSVSKTGFVEKSASPSTFSAKSTLKALDFVKSPVLDKNHHTFDFTLEDSFAEVKQDASHQFEEMNPTSRLNGQPAEGESVSEYSRGKYLHPSPEELVRRGIVASPNGQPTSTRRGTVASPSIMTWGDNVSVRSLFSSKLFPDLHNLRPSPSNDILAKNESKEGPKFEECQYSTPGKNITYANASAVVDNEVAASKEIMRVLTSPFDRGNHEQRGEFNEIASLTIGGYKTVGRTAANVCVVSQHKEESALHSETFDSVSRTSTESLISKSVPANDHLRIIAQDAVAACTTKALDKLSLKRNLMESPSYNLPRNDLEKTQDCTISSLNSIQWCGRLESFSAEVDKERVFLSQNEVKMIQRSPKRQKVDGCNPEISLLSDVANSTTAQERSNWIDVCSKMNKEKIFIPELAVELSSKMTDTLEDILFRKLRSRMYDLLHGEAMALNTSYRLDLCEKIAETKSVLHRVVFEKSKLELMHLKKDMISKRLRLLSSSIQESRELRADLASQSFMSSNTTLTEQASGDNSESVSMKRGVEGSHEKLTAMKQTIASLDVEISNMMRRLHDCCELKTEPSASAIIVTGHKHLIKNASRRFIRSNMQNWVIHSLSSLSGQQNIMLNYLDLIIQSIQINGGLKSHTTTSFILNEANIVKIFPSMEACTAFSFLFNAETLNGFIVSRNLMWEIQVTNSLVGNLVDVVEEVQYSQIELHNLTEARFCLSTVDNLHLKLCFFGFKLGRKVTVTLDLTCLKRGIYPADVIPVQVNCSSDERRVVKAIEDKVKEEGIETGYPRILRLCRSLSKTLMSIPVQ